LWIQRRLQTASRELTVVWWSSPTHVPLTSVFARWRRRRFTVQYLATLYSLYCVHAHDRRRLVVGSWQLTYTVSTCPRHRRFRLASGRLLVSERFVDSRPQWRPMSAIKWHYGWNPVLTLLDVTRGSQRHQKCVPGNIWLPGTRCLGGTGYNESFPPTCTLLHCAMRCELVMDSCCSAAKLVTDLKCQSD